MPSVPASKVFKTDWTNREQVIALANNFGPGHTVYLRDSGTYGICHTSRPDLWDVPEKTVVHTT